MRKTIPISKLINYLWSDDKEKTKLTTALFKSAELSGAPGNEPEYTDREKYSYWKGYRRSLREVIDYLEWYKKEK